MKEQLSIHQEQEHSEEVIFERPTTLKTRLQQGDERLTDLVQKPYAGRRTMADTDIDPQDKKEPSKEATPGSQEFLMTPHDEELQSLLNYIDKELKNRDIKEWEQEEIDKTRTKLNSLRRKVRKYIRKQTGSKDATSFILQQADERARLFKGPSIIKRLLKAALNVDESEEDLKQLWYSQYSQQELKDPDLRSTIETAVRLGHKPATVTSKGLVKQTVQEVRENSLLEDEERKEKAHKVLDKLREEQAKQFEEDNEQKEHSESDSAHSHELSDEQKEAIIAAHNVGKGEMGKDGKPASIYNYTLSQIREKNRILKEAGLNDQQIRAILEAGIAGDGSDGSGGADGPAVTPGANLEGSASQRERQDDAETTPSEPRRRLPTPQTMDEFRSRIYSPEIGNVESYIQTQRAFDDYIQANPNLLESGIDEVQKLAQALDYQKGIFERREKDAQRRNALQSQQPAWSEADRPLFEGPVDKKIEERIKRIRERPGEFSLEDKKRYFSYLKRHANYALTSIERGTLKVSSEKEAILRQIVKRERTEAYSEELLDKRAAELQTVGLAGFFKETREGDPRQLTGTQPESIEQLMELIIQNYGREFDANNEYQLIDENSEVHIENFIKWMRDRIVEQDDMDPNGNINPLGQTSLQTMYGSISLQQILFVPKYTQTQIIELHGDETAGEEVQAQFKKGEKHEGFEQARDAILAEAWLVGLVHNFDAGYRQIRGVESKLGEQLQQFFRNNDFGRSNNLIRSLMWARADKDEFLANLERGEQGTIGKAIQQMLVANFYLSDLEWERDGLSPLLKKEKAAAEHHGHHYHGPEKGTNMFYKVMGDNIGTFFNSLASSALSTDEGAREEYRAFTLQTLQKEKTYWASHPQYAGRYAESEHLIDEAIKDLQAKRSNEIKVSLDYMTDLQELRFKILKTFTGATGVTKDMRRDVKRDVKALIKDSIKDGYVMKLQGKYSYLSEKEDPRDKHRKLYDVRSVDVGSFTNNPTDSNEKFALDIVKAIRGYSRKELNFYNTKKPSEELTNMVRNALRDSIGGGLDLDRHEADYSALWANRFVNWTGIAARNDNTGIGFDAWSKLINFQPYRERQFAERTQGGNLHNFPGIKSLSMTLWEGLSINYDSPISLDEIRNTPENERALKVQQRKARGTKTFLEVLQGGTGDEVKLDEKIQEGEMQSLSMQDFADTHLGNAFKMLGNILDKGEIHLEGLVGEDRWGNIIIHQEKMQEVLDNWWKGIRYTYDQLGFDYNKKMVFNGKEMTLREYFFDEDVINMGMYNYREKLYRKYKNVDNPPGTDWRHGTDQRMARNVWAYLIAKEIEGHLVSNRIHARWSYAQIYQLKKLFQNIGVTIEIEEHGATKVAEIIDEQFSSQEFERILQTINTSSRKMKNKEYAGGIITSIFLGAQAGLKEAGKHVKVA